MADWEGANVLVTGAAGFVGANLTRALLQRGARVSVFVRRETATWRLDEIRPRLNIRTVDLLDRASLREALLEIRPEFVFHLAIGRTNPYDLVSSNVMGTYHLLEGLKHVGNVRRMVHAGSSLEYGRKTVPLQEDQVLEPDTLHGASKAAGTLLVQQSARAGFPAVVLRIFSVYGCWEGANRLIPTAIVSCMERKELLLTGPGFRRDFVFVGDVVEALITAAERKNMEGLILNVATGIQTTNEDAVRQIQEVLGTTVPIRIGEYQPHASDTAYWVGNPESTAAVLEWRAHTDLRAGLEKTVSWFKSNMRFYQAIRAEHS